jgi:PIN domain nuclease of toxin-antitoxin system
MPPGVAMSTICDTHILLFWAHEPERLSGPALQALERGRIQGGLAIADITLWELALLHERGRLVLPADVSAGVYLKQLLAALRLQVLPITPEIALLSRSDRFLHGDPADRLIGATALQLGAPLITADAKLRALTELDTVW